MVCPADAVPVPAGASSNEASKLREGLWQMNDTQQLTISDIDPDSWYRTIPAQAAVRWPWGWMCASVLAACSVFVLR
jgi:hypothetical protein